MAEVEAPTVSYGVWKSPRVGNRFGRIHPIAERTGSPAVRRESGIPYRECQAQPRTTGVASPRGQTPYRALLNTSDSSYIAPSVRAPLGNPFPHASYSLDYLQ